ncbi:MAG TPA: LemA family protein [Pirellulaceae bacterium]|mgnify:CR=1 FL=1|nr:LemA family protein [Pirellulaceae bacterium]HMO91934.1 LemA family protein [Pirellulaceae bacterium]HMP68733.1 LemA family protein [Pirellulaceae bacterium]
MSIFGSFMGIMLIGLLVLAAVVFFMIITYNKLITYRNRYENAFKQIDVQLTRRYELIPNLVEVAKGYMKHEKETLEAVINARNQAFSAGQAVGQNPGDPAAIKNLAAAEQNLGGALGRLLMVAESYPDLKANQNMMALQEELTSTENKLAYARQGFNDAVTQFNINRDQFPANVVAGLFGFNRAELLEMEDPKARVAPKVSF